MPSFTNPYMNNTSFQSLPPRSSPMSAEDVLRRFLGMNHHKTPETSTVRPVVDSMMSQPNTVEWTVELAADLARLVLTLFEVDKSSCNFDHQPGCMDGFFATLFLLTISMEEWDGNIMYTVLLQEHCGTKTKCNLLEILFHLTKLGDQKDDSVVQISLVGIATAFRSMERLDRHLNLDPCRPDVGWWLDVDEERLVHLLASATSILISSENDRQRSRRMDELLPTMEQLQLAATTCLCTALRRDQLNLIGTVDETTWKDLCNYCLQKIQILINPQLPMHHSNWHLPCALASASLISLIQWRHDFDLPEIDRIITSTTLIDNVASFVIQTPSGKYSSHDSPRWTYDRSDKLAHLYGMDLLFDWGLSGGHAWSTFIKSDKFWRPCVETFWSDVASNEVERIVARISSTSVLHDLCRLSTRGVLVSTLHRLGVDGSHSQETAVDLLAPLCNLFQSNDFSIQIHAVSLVRRLLSDRRNLSTHDDISRAFWNWVDDKLVQRVIGIVLHLVQTHEANKPLMLAFLDLLDTLLLDQEHCHTVLSHLTAETLEQFISIIHPTKLKFDFHDPHGCWGDLSLDITTDTPPANNLSRADDKSVCIEQENKTIFRGVDIAIQLSSASAMARLGYSTSLPTDEGIHLWKARICTTVNNFATALMSGNIEEHVHPSSIDRCQRSFRLQLSIATPENEDLIVTTLFSKQMMINKEIYLVRRENERLTDELEKEAKRSKQLESDNGKLRAQNRSQLIVFKREMSRIRDISSQDAKQLVTIHATERSSAENRAFDCMQRLHARESQLEDARAQIEESQRGVASTKEELEVALNKARELETQNQHLSRQIDQGDARAREIKEEMQSQKEKLDSLFQARTALEDELNERDRAIKDCEASNTSLKENLEELFSDMVSMSTIYEAKENEVTKLQKNHYDEGEELKRKLQREREQKEELASTADRLRSENDKLYKKLAKYKERLEDERRERQEENNRRKRNGPVSYINQLHQSTSSDRSSRDCSRSRKESSPSKNRSRLDKENSHSYIGGPQRHKKY